MSGAAEELLRKFERLTGFPVSLFDFVGPFL
jgi:hypothetical protein